MWFEKGWNIPEMKGEEDGDYGKGSRNSEESLESNRQEILSVGH